MAHPTRPDTAPVQEARASVATGTLPQYWPSLRAHLLLAPMHLRRDPPAVRTATSMSVTVQRQGRRGRMAVKRPVAAARTALDKSLWATGSVLTVGRIVHAAPEIEIACRAEVLDSAGGRRAGGSIEVEEDTAGLHTHCACQHAAAADITLHPHPHASNPPLRTPTSAPSFPLSIEEKGHAAPRELWKTWASPR
ncbi:hypothetical protein C8R44DRAFT_752752 [Mycena epipterygia]|nr:hypothetical protein C8R44DRAFT_752752 [Mycena epipterygia]